MSNLKKENSLIGKTFNNLTIISDSWSKKVGKRTGDNQRFVMVRCKCGKVKSVRLSPLKNLRINYCSIHCPAKRYYPKNKKIYAAYNDMRGRCYNKNRDRYNSYGGRGIKVCSLWLKSYESFEKWSLSSGYKKGLTLDRIDVNKNYSPENCRWITKEEQGFNKRNTLYIKHQGKKKSLAKMCKVYDVDYKKAWYECIKKSIPFDEFLEKLEHG